ncbi:MAG: type II toxin-antitoxin system Phd/YefM family antitoxin [Actinomycetota bacterium]
MTLRVIGTTQMRDELAAVMDDLSDATAIIITHHGEGRAVLMQLERYNDLMSRLEYLEDSLDAAEATWDGAVPLEQVD